MPALKKPLTLEETRKALDDEGYLSVVVAFSFYELVDNDIEGINDLAESRIVEKGILADISYKVVGVLTPTDAGAGDVLVQVTAEVDLSLYEDDEETPA